MFNELSMLDTTVKALGETIEKIPEDLTWRPFSDESERLGDRDTPLIRKHTDLSEFLPQALVCLISTDEIDDIL